ncbi:MAG: mycothione reductase [Actinomycetota bacterium]
MTNDPHATPPADVETFDLIIVGSGSGNAIPDYLADWNIAMVERGTFGGTCLNVGCIPSKMFVLPADHILDAHHSERVNIDVEFHSADFPAIRDRVFGRIDAISAGGRDYRAIEQENITLIEGTARFIGDKVFHVDVPGGPDRTITAPKVLLAAGARPVIPPIPGLNETGFHTSDTIMRLDSLPRRLGIIGGGFIAVEMGHVFSALGSEVSMVNRSKGLLRGFDEEVARRFEEVFRDRPNLNLITGDIPERIRRLGDGTIEISCAGGTTVVDELLVATGRRPNSDLLDVQAGGLHLRDDETIVADDTMATTVEGVWALGDIANAYQLKHLANAEAKVAFWNLAHPDEEPRRVSYRAVPSAVFSNPQVATVGLTEEEARAQGRDVIVGRRDYAGTAYGWALVDETSFAKVLVDADTGLIIGAHIIGPQAATLIQPIIQAMEFEQTAEEVAEKPFYIHPALTEVVENALLEAVMEHRNRNPILPNQ